MTAAQPQLTRPYDAVLLLSFGGPERPEEVVPFLANVTRGSGIPESRLAEVGEHYFLFGGRSPINDLCRELKAALVDELHARGSDLPVYWGNRHWHPLLTDEIARLVTDGRRRVVALTTSAYPSLSGCRSYREEVAAAIPADADIDIELISPYGLGEGFLEANADLLAPALVRHPQARVVFVTHSIPDAMAATSGPPPHTDSGAYLDWHRRVATEVSARAGARAGTQVAWDLVFCSRSGPPGQPWLEPDINDHLADLSEHGVSEVLVMPIGFISDHMEVIFDLDTQAAQTAKDLNLGFTRVGTVGLASAFVAQLADLVLARTQGVDDARLRGLGTDEAELAWCGAECCPRSARGSSRGSHGPARR